MKICPAYVAYLKRHPEAAMDTKLEGIKWTIGIPPPRLCTVGADSRPLGLICRMALSDVGIRFHDEFLRDVCSPRFPPMVRFFYRVCTSLVGDGIGYSQIDGQRRPHTPGRQCGNPMRIPKPSTPSKETEMSAPSRREDTGHSTGRHRQTAAVPRRTSLSGR